jgi:uncharacterized membrane protein
MRIILSAFYIAAGLLHIISPRGFVLIIPHFVLNPEAVVFLTGICEVLGVIGWFIPLVRKSAGIGLAAYAVLVFPANINHALNMIFEHD